MRKLELIDQLLERLQKEGIIYCHWKSNDHLDAVMNGDSDLDILFSESQKKQLPEILEQLGFKLFEAIPSKKYQSIYDYMGLDLTTGKLVHLHAHFKLRFGHMYCMEYDFEIEESILNGRIFDSQYNIYRIDPSFEYVQFFLRESLKLRHRDRLKMLLKGRSFISKKRQKEYKWLSQKKDDQKVQEILKTHFKKTDKIFRLMESGFRPIVLYHLNNLYGKEYAGNGIFQSVRNWIKRDYYEIRERYKKIMSRIFVVPVPLRRINPRKGFAIALIGADGSGKSTVTKDLRETFKSKIDIWSIYFGRGDGRASPARRLLNLLKKGTGNKNETKAERAVSKQSLLKKGLLHKVFKIIEALLVAREKNQNLKNMLRAKNNGMIAICDRFPQNQIEGFNDGPLLYELMNSGNPIFRLAARSERKAYELSEKTPPDLIIKLIAEPEVVEARKPGETSMEKLREKIEGIKSLKFGHACDVITIDASEPLETVLRNVKREMWNRIN